MGCQCIKSQNSRDKQDTNVAMSISYLAQHLLDQEPLTQITKGQMSKTIHKNIGALIFRNKVSSVIGKGTGVLISPNLVLTSAHNIWNRKAGAENIQFSFYPKQHGELKQSKSIERIFYPSVYRTKQSVENDYALLKLTEEVEDDDFLPLGELKDEKEGISIFGYPEQFYKTEEVKDKKGNTKTIEKCSQWGLIKRNGVRQINTQKALIVHDIQVLRGQQGSPMISIVGTKLKIVGISKGSISEAKEDKKVIKNVGRLINQELVTIFKKEAIAMGAKMFEIDQQLQLTLSNNRRVEQYPRLQRSQRQQHQIKHERIVSQVVKRNQLFSSTSGNGSLEARDRHIILDMPQSSQGTLSKGELQKWITNVCLAAFSSSFNYYETGQMTFDQVKIFSSETILGNILRLTEKYKLGESEIQIIDNHLKFKVLEYMSKKYPLTTSVDVNKALEKVLLKTNTLDQLENDFLYSNKIIFKYRQDGNYNDIIMITLNRLMEIADENADNEYYQDFQDDEEDGEKETLTNYQDFQDSMVQLFQKVFNEEDMAEQGKIRKKKSLVLEDNTNKDKQASKKQYRQKVKQYTSYKIGRKISENTAQFTQQEIQGKNLIIKSSAILRILTKWCEQLWHKFQNENYFTERSEPILLEDPEYINPFFKWMKTSLDKRLKGQKIKLLEFKKKLNSDCHFQESVVLRKYLEEDDNNYIPKYQKAYGKFATHMVKNLHTYIVQTLNRLIHGLLTVSKEFFEKEIKKDWEDWAYPPNLITFKVGDLMRCKLASKEAQILVILKNLVETGNYEPERLRILRIKNRLRLGTNDILINVKFSDKIIAEIQLKVNNKQSSNFISCSNAFSHYIYELQRSTFGPISQLCNIWNNLDARASAFQSLLNLNMKYYDPHQVLVIPSCQKSDGHQYVEYISPFQCSICFNFYFNNNYILSNKQCKSCLKFCCVRCQIKSLNSKELKDQIFRNKRDRRIKDSCNKLASKDIPQNGVCFKLNMSQPKLQVFKCMKLESKLWMFGKTESGQLYQIQSIKTSQARAKFMRNYCVFNLVRQHSLFIKINQKQATHYAIKAYVKECYQLEKRTLILTQIRLTVKQMQELLHFEQDFSEGQDRIIKIEYASNYIDNISYFSKFENVIDLNLDYNHLVNTKPLTVWKYLQKLSIRDNGKLGQLGPQIGQLIYLTDLKASQCRIAKIADNIGKLQQLTTFKLNKNQLKGLPNSICNLKSLEILNIARNYISKLPEQFGKLVNLKKLNAGFNTIDKLPSSFTKLKNLQLMWFQSNKLKQLPGNFKELTSLQKLQLNSNAFEKLPQNCFEIQGLKTINLDKNMLEKFTCNMSKCTKLQILSLSSNTLSIVTSSIASCSQLQFFNLSDNNFSTIPTFIGDLKRLNPVFNFKNNQLKQIPQYFFKLNWMSEVNFQNNKIQKIHPDLANMFMLQEINLASNRITVINEQFKKLNDLRQFSFKGNQIKTIPDFMLQFKYVTNESAALDNIFSKNQINQLKIQFINTMTDSIKFTSNSLTTMPILDLANKDTVKFIDFSNNKITQIPTKISEFVNLAKLNLSHNLIEIIPVEVSELKNIKNLCLFLKQNPVKKVECIEFVLSKGDSATRTLIRNLNKGGETAQRGIRQIQIKFAPRMIEEKQAQPEQQEQYEQSYTQEYDEDQDQDYGTSVNFSSEEYDEEQEQEQKKEVKKEENKNDKKKQGKQKIQREH